MRFLQIHLSLQKGGAYTCMQYLSVGLKSTGHNSIEIFQDPISSLIQFNYDFVLLHSFYRDTYKEYIEVLEFLDKYKIPHCILLHDYWPICYQSNLIRYADGLQDCEECGPNCDPYRCGYLKSYDKPEYPMPDMFALVKDRNLICFTEHASKILKSNNCSKVFVIPHGIDINLFKKGPVHPDKYTILFTNAWGQREIKGYKHWEWIMDHLDHVDFLESLGDTDYKSMRHLYNMSSCSLFLSLWHETFGLTIIESLACEIPVIAYPVGVAPLIIENGKNGYLIESFNARDVRDKIIEVQDNIKSMKAYCRESIIINKYTHTDMAQRYVLFTEERND